MRDNNFYLNRDDDIEVNCKNLIKKIDNYLDNKDFYEWKKIISLNTGLPEKEIDFFVKKNFFNSYDYKKFKFKNKISILLIPIYFLINIFYFFCIIFFKKNKSNKKKNFDLLLDNIKSQRELNRYEKLSNYFYNNLIAIRSSSKSKMRLNNHFVFYEKRFFNYTFNIKFLFFYIKMIIINLKISAKLRINFFYFFLNLIDDFLFFDSLFSKMNFKYVLSHIHYDTNNIKNYLLKKKCNGISMVIQKNINAKNQTGFFYHSDIVLTYGNKVKINENTKSYIGKQIPIGSFFMEYYYYTKPTNTKEGYDILCLGGNEHYPNSANDRSKFHRVDYIEHLNWLINISNEYPNLSIGFMHHANNKNKFEENFLKKSNIKIIEKNKNSYEISFNSKFICSWASSMIIEMQSLKKNSFYLDPKNRNNQFLGDISSSLNIRINSYEDFKNKVENLILKNMKDKQVLNFNLDDFCYVSDNCSEKIYELIVKNN